MTYDITPHQMPDPFPQPNWDLINRLHRHPPLVRNLRPWNSGDTALMDWIREHRPDYAMFTVGIGEIYQEAVTAHALLNMAGIPEPLPYAGDLDARVSTTLIVLADRVDRLSKITDLHKQMDGLALCDVDGQRYPCETIRLAKGLTHDDQA